jgi:hypothetical protein
VRVFNVLARWRREKENTQSYKGRERQIHGLLKGEVSLY